MSTLFNLITELAMLVVFIAIYAVILALPTMLLWNWVMPDVFGLETIGFFHALGLNLLCGVLVRSRTSSN